MPASVNPYVAGLPVGGTDAFVGRTEELAELTRALCKGQPQVALLTGSPGVGRSSFLQELERRLDAQGELHAVRVVLKDRVWDPLDEVISHMADSVGRTLRITEPELGPWAENRFAERWLPLVLERIHEDDGIVFLFDEFPVVFDPRSRQAAGALLPWLAGLLEQFPDRFRVVFTTDLRLPNQEAVFRRYFPTLHRLELGSLPPADSRRLVQMASADHPLSWSTEAMERVETLCGGHPYVLQLVCSLVWNHHQANHTPPQSAVRAIDVNALIEDALDAGAPIFETWWTGLPPACRVLAAALASHDSPSVAPERIVQILDENGILKVNSTLAQDAVIELRRQRLLHPRTDAVCFQVPLFRLWIRARVSLEVAFADLDHVVPEASRLFQQAERAQQTATIDATRRAAIDQLETVLRLNPNHTSAMALLALELERSGDLSSAAQHLERLFQVQPERARPKLIRVLLQLAEADAGTARETRWLDRVLALEPDHADARQTRKALHPIRRHFGTGRTIRVLTAATVLLAAGVLLSITIRPTTPPTKSVQALSSHPAAPSTASATTAVPEPVDSTAAASSPKAMPTGPAADQTGEQTVAPPDPARPLDKPSNTPSEPATKPNTEPATEPTASRSAATPAASQTPKPADRTAPRATPPNSPAATPTTRARRPTSRKTSASDALVQKGWTALEAGVLSEAQAHFDAAVRSSPRNPDAHYSLAYTAEKLGDLDIAKTHYCSTLRHAPPGSVVHRDVKTRLSQLQLDCD